MPRFVVLRHETPEGSHFDLMLESGDVLKTWSLSKEPQPGTDLPCIALPDHRLAYLDYEGPVSGGRGSVVRWDTGSYNAIKQTDTQWELEMVGQFVKGRVLLTRAPDTTDKWLFRLQLNQ